MWVSSGLRSTHLRTTKPGELNKNGSFIDVWFERDGIKQWIGIPIDTLQKFLESPDKKVEAYIEVDDAATLETSLVKFLRSNLVQRLMRDEGIIR